MNSMKYLFLISITAIATTAVKVNMHGSVSLGKQVLDTISYYLLKSSAKNGRRMLSDNNSLNTEVIKKKVESAYLCKGLNICEEKTAFLNEYITVLANALEGIFTKIMNGTVEADKKVLQKVIFKDQLDSSLTGFRKMLVSANTRATVDADIWLFILKSISADFQKMSLGVISQRLQGDPKETKDVKKRLSQRLILAIIMEEIRYMANLCKQYNLCTKHLTCTTTLRRFLANMETMPDEKIRMFLKYFYEAIPDNALYFLNYETNNEFQVILSDMIYSSTVPTKDILMTVFKTVNSRKNNLESNLILQQTYDTLLIHIILSDLDYFYSKGGEFEEFLQHFDKWVLVGGKFHAEIIQVMNSLKAHLADQPPALVTKLTNEIRTFLEITVDPN